MSQDQIKLPEPDMEQVETYSGIAVNKVVTTHLYTAATVRRLIAEAVAAEREACAKACEARAPCNGRMDEWDAAAVTCAAAIRSRGDQT